MRSLRAPGLRSVTLMLDGQTLQSPGSGGVSKDFTWPGMSSQGAQLSGNTGGTEVQFIPMTGL
jgi:type VI protein secretion system component VasK